MKKRIFSMLLCICMVCSLLPITAGAAVTSLTVAGTDVVSGDTVTYWLCNGDGTITSTGASENNYHVKYEPKASPLPTITLNGATIKDNGIRCESFQGDYIIALAPDTTNSVTTEEYSAIVSTGGSVTIKGNGTLNVEGADNGFSVAYTVAIGDGATVNATGKNGMGIYISYDWQFTDGVRIDEGGTATIIGKTYGIGAADEGDAGIPPVINSPNVTIKGETAAFGEFRRGAPTLGTGIGADASGDFNGSGPVEYSSGSYSTYKWFQTYASATAPTVTKGENLGLTYGYDAGSISVTAEAIADYTLSYQWYSCNADGSNSQSIPENAQSNSYTIPTGKNAGTYYYYCAVTSKRNSDNRTATTNSGVIAVTVNKAMPQIVTWATIRTPVYVNDPYLYLDGGVAHDLSDQILLGNFECGTADLTSAGLKNVTLTYYPMGAAATNYNHVERDGGTAFTVRKRQVESVAVQSSITDKIYGTAQNALGLPTSVTITTSGDKTFDNVPVTWSGYNANTLEEQTLTGTLDLSAIATEVEQPSTEVKATIAVDLQERTPGAYTYQPKTETYTGEPIKHEIAVNLEGVTSISYSYVGTGETVYAASENAPTNAGTYNVTATFTTEDGYSAVAPKTATLTINKAEISEPTVSGNCVYNCGQDVTPTLIGFDENTMTKGGQTSGTAAGSYTITFTLKDTDNYRWANSADGSVTWSITKATPTGTPTYTAITAAGKTLADAALSVGSIAPAGGTITWDLGNEQSVVANTAYAWTYAPADTANYNNLTGSITPYVVTSSGDGDDSYDYDYDYTPPSYKVEDATPDKADGSITSDHTNAQKGDDVTITVTPDRYYNVDGVIVKDRNGKEIPVTMNPDGTFSFKMPAGKVTVEPVFVWDNPFADVDEETEDAEPVEWALKNGITTGMTDTTFAPDGDCTRAQIVTFLWRAAGSPEPTGSEQSFTDVDADDYFAKAVLWALENGITTGMTDTTFAPDAVCTRAQTVTFLHRAAGKPATEQGSAFGDVAADSYYAQAVVWAEANGITKGIGDSLFGSLDECTRIQIVTFLYRFLGELTD